MGRPKLIAMEGTMKRKLLAKLLAWMLICGCAGRVDTDLLQARIREQASQITESQREIAKTRLELKRTRLEADKLKSELANSGRETAVPSVPTVTKLRIHALSSGGLNKDDLPGDDVVVIQFAPLDSDQEAIQVPGDLEFTLVDPLVPEPDRELGRWEFTAEECRTHWTRGITSSGFQFSLPLESPPQHANLVMHLKYKKSDGDVLDLKHIVKVIVPPPNAASKSSRRKRLQPVRVVDESNEFLPPVGDGQIDQNGASQGDWDDDKSDAASSTPGRAVLHSSSWTDATIPQFR